MKAHRWHCFWLTFHDWNPVVSLQLKDLKPKIASRLHNQWLWQFHSHLHHFIILQIIWLSIAVLRACMAEVSIGLSGSIVLAHLHYNTLLYYNIMVSIHFKNLPILEVTLYLRWLHLLHTHTTTKMARSSSPMTTTAIITPIRTTAHIGRETGRNSLSEESEREREGKNSRWSWWYKGQYEEKGIDPVPAALSNIGIKYHCGAS